MLASSGCALFQCAVDSLNRWQANRCNCKPNECICGNNNCHVPCVTLAKPKGYLEKGPVFSGEEIVGSPAKTAIDRMLELQDEVARLNEANAVLERQLEQASATIDRQSEEINVANTELEKALTDFQKVRVELAKWYADLDELGSQVREREQVRSERLRRFEKELQDILSECEKQAAEGDDSVVSLVAPQNRVGTARSEAIRR